MTPMDSPVQAGQGSKSIRFLTAHHKNDADEANPFSILAADKANENMDEEQSTHNKP